MTQDLLYKSYADLDAEISELETLRESLRAKIIEAMKADGLTKAPTPFGTFSVAHKVTWSYSKAIKELDQKLKIKKIQEQKKGLATPTRNAHLMFRMPGEITG